MRSLAERECVILVGVAALVAVLFYGLPLGKIIAGSLYGTSGLTGSGSFVGAANFKTGWGDPALTQSLLATVALTIPSVILQVGLAFAAALLTYRSFPGVGLLRWMLMVPYFLPTVVVVVIWRFFSDPFVGLLPLFIHSLGFTALDLRGPVSALPTMVLVAIYEAFPFAYIVLLARLMQIPKSFYEVAQLSGASLTGIFRAVTWPQIRLTLGGLLLLRTLISCLKFDVPWLVYAAQAPSPWGDTLAVMIYRIAFERLQQGQSYAVSFSFIGLVWAGYALLRLINPGSINVAGNKSVALLQSAK